MDDGCVGVYVHVPFCERICPYCDFAVVAARRLAPEVEARYVAALLGELAQRQALFAGRRLASLYLGGGTPALLTPESLARIVDAVRAAFPAGDAALELTLEVNPSSVERGRLPGFRAAGVSRLSLGVQSFDDRTLKVLGRAHRADASRAALAAAREAGFENVSLDLLFGVPGQGLAAVERDVAEAARFTPAHVSVYELTVEEGTPYATGVARGQLVKPAEDETLAMMEAVRAGLGAAGLEPYELSSYARPGFESVHNRRYWERRAVLGLGMGAWSCEPARPGAAFGARRVNPRSLAAYLERVEAGRPAAEAPAEVLDAATARGEAAFLALRTRRGLEAAGFAAEFGRAPRELYGAAIDELRRAGLLEENVVGDLRLTPEGRRLSDTVFERFV
jgi:oxygen-independent coproporphyrinogen-3 oxidase